MLLRRRCCCPPDDPPPPDPHVCDCVDATEPTLAADCSGCVPTSYRVTVSGLTNVSCSTCGSLPYNIETILASGEITCCLSRCNPLAAPCGDRVTDFSPWLTAGNFLAYYGQCTGLPTATLNTYHPPGCTSSRTTESYTEYYFHLYLDMRSSGTPTRAGLVIQTGFGFVFMSLRAGVLVDACESFTIDNVGLLCGRPVTGESSHFEGGTATVRPCCLEEDI